MVRYGTSVKQEDGYGHRCQNGAWGRRPNRGARRILEAAFMKSGDAATSPFEIATRARFEAITPRGTPDHSLDCGNGPKRIH
jgi:hypothetical protein